MELLRVNSNHKSYEEALYLLHDYRGFCIEFFDSRCKTKPCKVYCFNDYKKCSLMNDNKNMYLWILKCATDCTSFNKAKLCIKLAEMYKEEYID